MIILLFFLGVRFGEHLQRLAEDGMRNYSWLQGHFSGFCFSAQWSATALLLSEDTRLKRGVFIVPLLLSLHELFPIIAPSQGVADIQDALCYFGGTTLVCLLHERLNTGGKIEILSKP
ncbi:MAG: hypothetical protein ACRBF0_19425 [Calditrichia bacterium]